MRGEMGKSLISYGQQQAEKGVWSRIKSPLIQKVRVTCVKREEGRGWRRMAEKKWRELLGADLNSDMVREALPAGCMYVCVTAAAGPLAPPAQEEEEEEEEGVIEYLIKWKGKSYIHSSWHTGTLSSSSSLIYHLTRVLTPCYKISIACYVIT